MIRNIIFDLDGTLADTILDIRSGLNGMLTEYGFSTVTKEQTLANINNGALELVRRSLPEKYRCDDSFVKDAKLVYEKYYSICYNDLTAEYSGCNDALKKLACHGVSLSVLSNKQDEFVKKIVQKLFPDIPFKFVFGQSDKFPTKPDPSSILYILDELSIPASETALIGDSNVDILTAKNAHVLPIGVSWGYRNKDILLECGARHIIDTPADITDIISIFK